MAPKRNPPLRRAAAKAKAAALALRVSTSNARRDRRRDACRSLNQLANELGVGQAAVDAKGASGAEVDRFIRILERRVLSLAPCQPWRRSAIPPYGAQLPRQRPQPWRCESRLAPRGGTAAATLAGP